MNLLKEIKAKKEKIGIVGLGYVGLPLAVAFAEKFKVIGFDINQSRINELKRHQDMTREISKEELKKVAENFELTQHAQDLKNAKIIIVTVPTPIDYHKSPDLTPIKKATQVVGQNLQKGMIIVYESTVYPTVTRDICVPILEEQSGLKWMKDFFVGYSPERINPGDKQHTVKNIIKVVAGDTQETLNILADIYGAIVEAGVHKVTSLEVAEAAKIIENTQRDLNIALMNELAIIFNKLNINTQEVLTAAGTKWNFLKYKPGLVGGHCIGVDPYYLTFKAKEIGYHPEIILAGRRINDSMGKYIADQTVKSLINAGHTVKNARVLILGITFKENISDIRNTRVVDIINELREYNIDTLVYDPDVIKEEVKKEYHIDIVDIDQVKDVNAVILAVAHDQFLKLNIQDFNKFYKNHDKKVFIDVKSVFTRDDFTANGYVYWSL